MTPITDSFWYLSKVTYLEEKSFIVTEFSNNEKKNSQVHRFFPRILVPVSKNTEPIVLQLLNSFGAKKFHYEKKNDNTLSITAKAFSDLKRFCNLLNSAIKIQPMLIAPEQQFLLEKNYSFFDSFEKKTNGMEKTTSTELPAVCFDWLGGKLEIEMQNLIQKERGVVEKILEAITMSNALCIPIQELPQQKSMIAETFIQNACFKNNIAFQKENNNVFSNNKFGYYNGDQSGFSELDFSKTWPALFGFHFFNLSIETIDCDCCVPETAFEQNILPSSMVEVEFTKNGFFFESKTENFSLQFHENNNGKESRLSRQKEFYLKTMPTGPFNSGEKAIVPIEDALSLAKEESAKITNAETELHWFCKRKEGILSKELNELNKKIVFFSHALEEKRKTAILQHGILAENELFFDVTANYQKKATECLSALLESIPLHLLSPNSRFYCKQLASAFVAIQSNIIKNFSHLGIANGAKTVAVGSNKCLISNREALSVSKEFCQKTRLPMPAIR